MTLAWINDQIEHIMSGPDRLENVHDLAMLLIVRDHLQAVTNRPTLAQVEHDLAMLVEQNGEDLRRIEDLQTWALLLESPDPRFDPHNAARMGKNEHNLTQFQT